MNTVYVFNKQPLKEDINILGDFLNSHNYQLEHHTLIYPQTFKQEMLETSINMLESELGLDVLVVCLNNLDILACVLRLKQLRIIQEKVIDIQKYLYEISIINFHNICDLTQFSKYNLSLMKNYDLEFVINFYQSHGSIADIARKFYMHRNTVLYKIDRINRLTKLNIKNMQDLKNLYFNILIYLYY